MRKALYVDHIAILDENECPVGYEIKMKKRQIEDSQPVHVGTAIRKCNFPWSRFNLRTLVQQSKLLFNLFVYFLYEHLQAGSWHTGEL